MPREREILLETVQVVQESTADGNAGRCDLFHVERRSYGVTPDNRRILGDDIFTRWRLRGNISSKLL